MNYYVQDVYVRRQVFSLKSLIRLNNTIERTILIFSVDSRLICSYSCKVRLGNPTELEDVTDCSSNASLVAHLFRRGACMHTHATTHMQKCLEV